MEKYIIGFIFGIVLAGGIVLATTSITADQVNYDVNTTVKDKIDDLYTTSNNLNTELNKYRTLSVNLTAESSSSVSGSGATIHFYDMRSVYNRFRITKKNMRTGCTSCNFVLQGYDGTVQLNTYYNTADYNYLITYANGAPCDITVEFSNSN